MARVSMAIAVALAGLSMLADVALAEPALVVIGAGGSVDARLGRETLARVFLRKQLLWASGTKAQPVNLPATHPTRIGFSQTFLGGAPESFQDYWRDMYFHGVLPPHVVASEDAVERFVASTPGAIGYLSTCPKVEGVVVMLVVGLPSDCARP